MTTFLGELHLHFEDPDACDACVPCKLFFLLLNSHLKSKIIYLVVLGSHEVTHMLVLLDILLLYWTLKNEWHTDDARLQ